MVTIPEDAAVLIDDNRHLGFLFLKGFEQVRTAVGFGDEDGFADKGEDWLVGNLLHCFGDAAQHILGVDDADDVVDVILIDRDTGVAFVDGKLDDVHHGSGVFYGGNVGSVGHYILHGDVVEFKDVVNHVGFILFDGAFFVADIDHHADFLFGDLLRLVIGVDTEQMQDQVGCWRKAQPQRAWRW